MKTSREEILKENATLRERIEQKRLEDENVRKVLSGLLDSYEYTQEYSYSNRKEQKILIRDWVGIAFLIGELKADANYSMVIETREILRREKNDLEQKLFQLQNPTPNKIL